MNDQIVAVKVTKRDKLLYETPWYKTLKVDKALSPDRDKDTTKPWRPNPWDEDIEW